MYQHCIIYIFAKSTISYIPQQEVQQRRVYVHCGAGHGWSAAVALAWLMYKHPDHTPKTLNQKLCQIQNICKTLFQQPTIMSFHNLLLEEEDARTAAPMSLLKPEAKPLLATGCS